MTDEHRRLRRVFVIQHLARRMQVILCICNNMMVVCGPSVHSCIAALLLTAGAVLAGIMRTDLDEGALVPGGVGQHEALLHLAHVVVGGCVHGF